MALVVGLVVSLAYVIFLPLVGFVMLAALLTEKLFAAVGRLAGSATRARHPAWVPARATLGRGRQRREAEGGRDEWAEETAADLDAEEAAQDHEETE